MYDAIELEAGTKLPRRPNDEAEGQPRSFLHEIAVDQRPLMLSSEKPIFSLRPRGVGCLVIVCTLGTSDRATLFMSSKQSCFD